MEEKMKKTIALLLVVLLLFTLAVSAFAEEGLVVEGPGTGGSGTGSPQTEGSGTDGSGSQDSGSEGSGSDDLKVGRIIEEEFDHGNPDAGMTDGDHGEDARRLYESLIDAPPFDWGEGGTGTYDIGDGTRSYTFLTDTLKTLKKKGLKTLRFNMRGNEYEISMADLLDNLRANGAASVTTKLDGRDGLKLVGSAKTRDGVQEYTIAVLRPIELLSEEALRTPQQSAVAQPAEAQSAAVQPAEEQSDETPSAAPEQSSAAQPAEAQAAAVQAADANG